MSRENIETQFKSHLFVLFYAYFQMIKLINLCYTILLQHLYKNSYLQGEAQTFIYTLLITYINRGLLDYQPTQNIEQLLAQ